MKTGWIKLHRSILDSKCYSKLTARNVFIHILLNVNFKESYIDGEHIPKGSCATSVKSLSTSLSLSTQQVRSALAFLEKNGNITIKTTNQFSVITVENWGRYQDDDKQNNKQNNNPITNEQQSNNNPITNEQQSNNNRIRKKEGKKERKKECKKYIEQNAHDEWRDTFLNFFEERETTMKAPMSLNAVKLAINKLNTLTGNDDTKAKAIIEQSIMNGWKSFYALKNNNKNQTQQKERVDVMEIDVAEIGGLKWTH